MAKIFLFTGDDLVSSRRAFLEKIESLEKDKTIQRVESKEIEEILIENVFGASDLFGQSRVLVTENFFSGKKSKDKEKLIEKILGFPNAVAVSWEEKELSKTENQKLGKSVEIRNFKLPNLLFSFLDNLSPDSIKTNLSSFHFLTETVDPQFIFLMIVRQFRLMILAIEDENETISPWQRTKLKKQSLFFGWEKLKNHYRSLLKIDINQKTSISPLNISAELDLFLSNL